MSQASSVHRRSLSLLREIGRTVVGRVGQSREQMKASATLAGGMGSQLAFQMLYFLLLTRMFGPELFGRYATALAAVILVSPIAGLGFADIALVRISQDKEKTGLWAMNALAVTAAIGAALAIGLAFVFAMLSSASWLGWEIVLLLAINELVFVRCCFVIARVYQGRREIGRTSFIYFAVAGLKAMIALGLYLSGNKSLMTFVLLLNLCFVPLLLLLFLSLARRTSAMEISLTLIRDNFREAFSFATGIAGRLAYAEVDKLFLAHWTTTFVVGTYAAGYKILMIALMPIWAILETTYPRQIELAHRDRKACVRYTIKVLVLNLVLASGIACALFLSAPWVTYVLGDEYRESIGVLRIGFLLPLLQAVHYTLGNFLAATGHQTARAVTQLAVLAVFVVIAVIVIPNYSWEGAIWAHLVCESLLALLLGIGCLAIHKEITQELGI